MLLEVKAEVEQRLMQDSGVVEYQSNAEANPQPVTSGFTPSQAPSLTGQK
jgi:hypothetical protein